MKGKKPPKGTNERRKGPQKDKMKGKEPPKGQNERKEATKRLK